MQHTRVLGTLALVGATVLSAMGPSGASHAAPAAKSGSHKQHLTRVSIQTAIANEKLALRTGLVKTARGGYVPLSSALVNAVQSGRIANFKPSASAAAGHADSRAGSFMQVGAGSRANQDFGYYYTGNGQLFHNTESIAVDPLSPVHVVVSATDTRAGSDSSNFNFGSEPKNNAIACLGVTTQTSLTPLSCALIQALGGPGIYNTVDYTQSGGGWTDLIIPDMISGGVPNALVPPLDTISVDALGTAGTGIAPDTSTYSAAIQCINPSGAPYSNGINSPGIPNDCLPYDSVGDQSVAFDNVGNLYVASLGLVSYNPIIGAGPDQTTGGVQTDVVINVSPAVQPVYLSIGNGLGGGASTPPPDAAGRFFNAWPPIESYDASNQDLDTVCDPYQFSTTVCLHNEVTASNYASNFIGLDFSGYSYGASVVGRNWQADATTISENDSGPGLCGTDDVCIIDQPYLAINTAIDATAFLTFTVIDFSAGTSNVYLQTAHVPANVPNDGTLPAWTVPVLVDNVSDNSRNLYCAGLLINKFVGCVDSWGAEPTTGPDGTVYVAYENGDLHSSYIPIGGGASDLTGLSSQYDNLILVAVIPAPAANAPAPTDFGVSPAHVSSTAMAAEVLDHDAYNYYVAGNPFFGPASLDPASGAYFTIPNRPTIAVTGPYSIAGGKKYNGGIVIVAWTDQRSLPNGKASLTSGTRVWYSTAGSFGGGGALTFNALGPGPFGIASSNAIALPTQVGTSAAPAGYGLAPALINGVPSYYLQEVYEPNGTYNQFFPWVTASQQVFANASYNDNIFLGFYQETPGTLVYAPDYNSQTSSASLTFWAAKSKDFGASFGLTPAGNSMPLPNPPVSPAYCAAVYGFDFTKSTANQAATLCNQVPYFGTYTGAASDLSNGAFLSWTDTRASSRNFNVNGSQDAFLVHVN